ncbi:MAG: hypothetical protein E3J86_03965 [Candidatus Thorarchaeota archaeon]|nr:MAG: hypothetical protein E3J86_03965 [Candidatus Thorarchaeota archaeon]
MSKHPIYDELSCPNCKRIANWVSIRVYKNANIIHMICSCGQIALLLANEEGNLNISATVHSELGPNGEWVFVTR